MPTAFVGVYTYMTKKLPILLVLGYINSQLYYSSFLQTCQSRLKSFFLVLILFLVLLISDRSPEAIPIVHRRMARTIYAVLYSIWPPKYYNEAK